MPPSAGCRDSRPCSAVRSPGFRAARPRRSPAPWPRARGTRRGRSRPPRRVRSGRTRRPARRRRRAVTRATRRSVRRGVVTRVLAYGRPPQSLRIPVPRLRKAPGRCIRAPGTGVPLAVRPCARPSPSAIGPVSAIAPSTEIDVVFRLSRPAIEPGTAPGASRHGSGNGRFLEEVRGRDPGSRSRAE